MGTSCFWTRSCSSSSRGARAACSPPWRWTTWHTADNNLIHIGHGDVLLAELALSRVALGLVVLAVEDGLAVFVELQLGDHALRRVDTDLHGGAAGLLARNALDVDDPLFPVALDNLALPH